MRYMRIVLPVIPLLLLAACRFDGEDLKELASPRIKASEAECMALAHAIEEGMTHGNGNALDSTMDLRAFFQRISGANRVSESEQRDFETGFRSRGGIGEQFLSQIGSQGSFRLLKLQWDNGAPRARYRLIGEDGGVSYLDLLLGDREGGGVGVIDIYSYLTGEYLTVAIRRMVRSDNLFAKLVSGDDRSLFELLDSVSSLTDQEEYRKVVECFEALPEKQRKNKTLQRYYIDASRQLEDDQYVKALAEFQRLNEGDPSGDLTLIDHYILRREFPAALAAIDRVEKAIGGDPYLDDVRADILLEQGDIQNARKMITRAIQADSTLIHSYLLQVTAAAQAKDHKLLAATFDVLQRKFGYDINSDIIAADTLYADFVQSAEYRKWERRQAEE